MKVGYQFLKLVGFGFIFLSTAPMYAICVNVKKAELKREPHSGAETSLEVFRYMPLEKVSKKEGWYNVKDFEGKTHWIKEDQVTTAFECAVIQAEFANLRKGPGVSFPHTRAEKGIRYLSFRLVKRQDDWVEVEDSEGDHAWIHKPLVWIR